MVSQCFHFSLKPFHHISFPPILPASILQAAISPKVELDLLDAKRIGRLFKHRLGLSELLFPIFARPGCGTCCSWVLEEPVRGCDKIFAGIRISSGLPFSARRRSCRVPGLESSSSAAGEPGWIVLVWGKSARLVERILVGWCRGAILRKKKL